MFNHIADESYRKEMQRVEKALKLKKEKLSLQPLNSSQVRLLLTSNLMPSCVRLIQHLFANQGTRTDKLSHLCAVGNPSDVFMKSRGTLQGLGLNVVCDVVKSCNRYGSRTVIGTWWVIIESPQKWNKACAIAERQFSSF